MEMAKHSMGKCFKWESMWVFMGKWEQPATGKAN